MANFLAYFDLLGYKKFIEKNTDEVLNYRTDHFARNIERALALDRPDVSGRRAGIVLSDISHSTLNCLTFSDTVIFWTTSNDFSDFEEILRVAYKYNHFNIMHDFPSRGCIVYGDIWFKPFDSENLRGSRYMLNMIYGKALIDAHLRAEAMNWAGCELHASAVNYAKTLGDISPLLHAHTLLYDIPFKGEREEVKQQGYALRLATGRLLITQFYEEGIASSFTQDNKGEIEGRTKVIYDNTINFLRAHKIVFPFVYQLEEVNENNIRTQTFGKFEEDYKHTVVKIAHGGDRNTTYEIKVSTFVREQDDRDFLDAQIISEEVFDEQLILAENNLRSK